MRKIKKTPNIQPENQKGMHVIGMSLFVQFKTIVNIASYHPWREKLW